MTIGDEVDKLYRAHATYDARRIAKDKKIDILVMPLDSDTCGLTVRNSRFNTIILNELIEENLQEYTLCHELGHCVLHKQASTPFMRSVSVSSSIMRLEAEAHCFAFELLNRQYAELSLMSKEAIAEYFGLPHHFVRFM